MSGTTGIEWADATVNVWTGCTKVSPACKHCYAETDRSVLSLGARVRGKGLPMWGVNGYRYETVNWERELWRLNRNARENRQFVEAGNLVDVPVSHDRPRVFINSLSDVFEDFTGDVYRLEDGKPVVVSQSLDNVRARFFRVAEECTELDILLLTKRPENILRMVPHMSWHGTNDFARTHCRVPPHVWIGTTVEDQDHADKRIPELLKVPAKVRFLSVEPLLGLVDLAQTYDVAPDNGGFRAISWVIVGGESGNGARPMHPDWVCSIRDQCVAAGVPYFFKQWGEFGPRVVGSDREESTYTHVEMRQVGKKNAGRLLDGREWNEVPGDSGEWETSTKP